MGPFDFPTVQWARKMTGLNQQFAALSGDDLQKLTNYLTKLTDFREQGGELTDQQLQVIMQNLHLKTLVKLEPLKQGNVYVEFTGGGFEYERFLLRPDGRMPNHKYESQKASS